MLAAILTIGWVWCGKRSGWRSIFGYTLAIDKSMSMVAGDALKKRSILEAENTVWFNIRATLALFIVIGVEAVGTSLTLLSRLAYGTVLEHIVAEIALYIIAPFDQVHLIVTGQTSLLRVTSRTTYVTLLAFL